MALRYWIQSISNTAGWLDASSPSLPIRLVTSFFCSLVPAGLKPIAFTEAPDSVLQTVMQGR